MSDKEKNEKLSLFNIIYIYIMAIVGRTIITIVSCPCSFNDKTGPW